MQPHNSQMGVKRTTPSIPAREEIFADLTFRSERRPEQDVRHWRDEQTIEDMHQRSRGAKRVRGLKQFTLDNEEGAGKAGCLANTHGPRA
jgi:hypothetical protein